MINRPALALVSLTACSFDVQGVGEPSDGAMQGGTIDAGDVPGVVDAGPVDARPVDAAPPDAAVCPNNYTRSDVTGSAYRVRQNPRTWRDAESDCEKDGPGIHLAVVESAAEVTFVDGLAPGDAWIGVTDLVTEGTWLRVVGGEAAGLPWAENEPNDFGAGEDCVELSGARTNDESCGIAQAFVCECDGQAPDPTTFPP